MPSVINSIADKLYKKARVIADRKAASVTTDGSITGAPGDVLECAVDFEDEQFATFYYSRVDGGWVYTGDNYGGWRQADNSDAQCKFGSEPGECRCP